MTDCSVWAGIDTQENIISERQARAMKARAPDLADDPFILDSPVTDFYRTNKGKQRVRALQAMVSTKRGALSGAVSGDVSQNAECMFRGGPWLPTLARSTDAVLFKDGCGLEGHFYTPAELACSQGWPAVPTKYGMKYQRCLGFDLGQLPRQQQRSLQGNGMHLASWGSFVSFVLAHVFRRDIVSMLHPPVLTLPVESDDDLDDESDLACGE